MSDPIPQMDISIKVSEHETFDRDVSADLRVDEHNLDESLMNQAALYAYYSSLYWRAQRLSNLKALELESLISDLWEQARSDLSQGSSSKWAVSKDRVEQAINRQPKIRQLKVLCVEAENNARKLYGLMKALEHKKDMIQNLCYNKRKEMDFVGSSRVTTRNNEIPISGNEG